ncbi:GNAT family N-acetyltransferase [Nocardia sp. NBC_00881]|uniref:GNAT family N-acetyltransferase n=1 Tax=Nocardia sp. NBC_00881 TaxID=2975995 RepID=UPI003867CB4F|nr:GNAT family N-acetyltransferase [Nocardia sp. NBC_00881]
MKVQITTDVDEFRSRAESFLHRDPLRHTVITTTIANRVAGIDSAAEPSRFLSVHAEDASVVGAAMRVAGRELYLGELPPDSVAEVVEALAEVVPESGGVEGVVGEATAFAQHWCKLLGTGFHEAYTVRLHRLGGLRVPDASGIPRPAVASDIPLCVDWLAAMRAESGMPPPGLNEAAIRRRVAAGRWWLWERAGESVSLAAHQVPVHGWSRIGPVYTPPDARGHGYASAVTAHVAQLLRGDGLDVCLFADTANTTANRIYRTIGFHPTHDFVHYVFD